MFLCVILRMIWQWVNILRGPKLFIKVKWITVGVPQNIRRRVYFPESFCALCFLVTLKVTDIKPETVIRAAAALAARCFTHSSTNDRYPADRPSDCTAVLLPCIIRVKASWVHSQTRPVDGWSSPPDRPSQVSRLCLVSAVAAALPSWSSSLIHPFPTSIHQLLLKGGKKKTPRASFATTVALRPPPLPASFLSLWYTSELKKKSQSPFIAPSLFPLVSFFCLLCLISSILPFSFLSPVFLFPRAAFIRASP